MEENPTEPKKADNDSDNDNEDDNDNEKIKKKKIKRKTFEDIFAENNFDEELETTLKDFIDMRKTIKKPMTTKALELLIKNLNKLTNLKDEKIAILNQSIEHGWQTVYPLKSDFSQSKSKGSINDFKELMEEAREYDERGNSTSNNTFSW